MPKFLPVAADVARGLAAEARSLEGDGAPGLYKMEQAGGQDLAYSLHKNGFAGWHGNSAGKTCVQCGGRAGKASPAAPAGAGFTASAGKGAGFAAQWVI